MTELARLSNLYHAMALIEKQQQKMERTTRNHSSTDVEGCRAVVAAMIHAGTHHGEEFGSAKKLRTKAVRTALM